MEVSLGAGRLHLHWGCHWDYRLDGVEGMKYQALGRDDTFSRPRLPFTHRRFIVTGPSISIYGQELYNLITTTTTPYAKRIRPVYDTYFFTFHHHCHR